MLWQPINSAPKDGRRILLYGPYQQDHPIVGWWVEKPKPPFAFVGWTDGWETNGGYDTGFNEIYKPTWWANIEPLPPV